MNYLKLTFDKLDVGALNDLVAHESCGAISLFVGTTRDNFQGKTVSFNVEQMQFCFYTYVSKILGCSVAVRSIRSDGNQDNESHLQ